MMRLTSKAPKPIPCTNARCEGGEIRTRAGRFADVVTCPDCDGLGAVPCETGCGHGATTARHDPIEGTVYVCTRHGGG